MEPVPSKKQLSHQRIVDAAARAMRRGGFAQVGVADVMKEAGLTHGGFYAHFDSREALLAEALTRAGQESAADLTRRAEARRKAKGASRLRALIESYLSETHLGNVESGCPLAALLSEVPRQSPELQDAALQRVHSLIASIRDALPDPQARDQAIVIAATLIGALQMARALGANAEGKSVLAAARQALLAAHDPA
jgi:TetR/AcrR family transcriptional repressor of nem operon